MAAEPTCPRCGGALLAPTVMHEQYECPVHGPVRPLHPAVLPRPDALAALATGSELPFWLPWPLPATWVFAGVQLVGGGREPVDAVTLGFTGHGMTQGPSDLLVIAERPGTGLGARWAGATEPDPDVTASPATTKARVAGHPTPLWLVETPGRAAFVGEAAGCWLWIITWPDSAWPVLDDHLVLVDARSAEATWADLPVGALLPRLIAGPGVES